MFQTSQPRPGSKGKIPTVCKSEDRSSLHIISPKGLLPYPHMAQKRKTPVRRRGKSVVITASPYNLELEERQRNIKGKKFKVQKANKIEYLKMKSQKEMLTKN